MRWKRYAAAGGILAVIFAGSVGAYSRFFAAGHATRKIADLSAMQSALDGLLPHNLPATEAKVRLEHEGVAFSRLSTNELYGNRFDGSMLSPVKRRWQVIVSLESDRVTGVKVTTGLTGP
jgi:hypothetical protein